MDVAAVMTRLVVTAEPTTSVRSALHLLRDGHFRHMPVVTGGRLVGVVSDRDLREESGELLADVMHTHVITVTADTPVEVAATVMAENKIGALPVLETTTKELVGIISQTDLFVVLARLLHGDGPSTRLEVRLTDLPRQLALIASIAEQEQVPITSLVTIPAAEPGDGGQTIVLRVGTIDPRAYISSLGVAGIKVDWPVKGTVS